MKIRMTVILVVMLLTVAGRAQAGLIFSISPLVVNAETSDSVQMNLIVAGLGADATPSLGNFDLDIGYDTAHLAVDSWLLGNALGDINLFEAVDFSLGDNMMGTLSLSVLSLLAPADLVSGQNSSFSLATITFEVLSLLPGEFTDVTIDTVFASGDEFGDPLDVDDTRAGRIGNGIDVPSPSTLGLMLSFLMLMLWRRKH